MKKIEKWHLRNGLTYWREMWHGMHMGFPNRIDSKNFELLKSKMADGRHVEKWPYFCNGLTNLHKICHGDAYWHSEQPR